jgi:predicted DNA-binding protein
MAVMAKKKNQKTLYVDMDGWLKDRIEAIAKRRLRKLTAEVRLAIERYCDEEEKKEGITPPPRPSDDSDE